MIEIDGLQVAVAGSADGRQVLVMAQGPGRGVSLSAEQLTKEVNRRYHTVKTTLDSHGIHVTRVIPMVQRGGVVGYFIEFDGDGYGILVAFSKN